MKKYLLLLLLTFGCAKGYVNIPDWEDNNNVPEELEKRANETINRPDDIDGNRVPGHFERRAKKEERMYNSDPPLFQ